MDFYLNLLNDKERSPDDQPSIGSILCAEKDDVEVEYALRTKANPIGIAAYALQSKLPGELKGKLPTGRAPPNLMLDTSANLYRNVTRLSSIMGRNKITLLPKQVRLLTRLGENLRLARLRRKLSAQQVSERAGLSRSTLRLLEQGSEGSSIGALLQVLLVLGISEDLAAVAMDDAMGRKLMDAGLLAPKVRTPRRIKPAKPTAAP